METEYDLWAGDLVLVDFSPVRGHEQDGTRPALVMTDVTYNSASSFIVICPITRNPKPWPFKRALPEGLKVSGHVMIDQIKSVDRRHRILRKLDRLPDDEMHHIRTLLGLLLGISNNAPGGDLYELPLM